MRRVDLYGECNVEGAPIDTFTAECCTWCVNPECTRSSHGKSKFDIRTSTWYDRLFANVPRMDHGDPRFDKISAQRFLAIQPPLEIRSSPWLDPRDVEANQVALQAPAVAPPAAPIEPPPHQPEPAQTQTATPAQAPKPSPSREQIQNLSTVNTPVQHGRLLTPPVGTPHVKAPSSWDAPVPSSDTEGVKVVKPGAKVKLR